MVLDMMIPLTGIMFTCLYIMEYEMGMGLYRMNTMQYTKSCMLYLDFIYKYQHHMDKYQGQQYKKQMGYDQNTHVCAKTKHK